MWNAWPETPEEPLIVTEGIMMKLAPVIGHETARSAARFRKGMVSQRHQFEGLRAKSTRKLPNSLQTSI